MADQTLADNPEARLVRLEEERRDLETRLRILEEKSNRYGALLGEAQTEVQYLRRYIDLSAQHALNIHGTEEGVREEVQRLRRLLDGDASLDVKGVRQELKETKEAVTRLITEKDAIVNQVKGARLLAGAIGLTTGGAIGFIMGLFGQ